MRALKRAVPDERRLRRVRGKGLLQLAATDGSLDRVARIADARVRACQDRGLIEKTRATDADFAIRFEGQSLGFSIAETVTRTERVETAAERRQREHARFIWDRPPQYDYHPTGRFTFRLKGYGNGHRVSWSDGKIHRLQKILNDIIAGAIRLAVHRRREREEREAQHRAWKDAQRLRDEQDRQEREERRRCERLMVRSKLWKMALQIREYGAAVEQAATRDGGPYEAGSREAAWRQWAMWIACQLDPADEEPLYHATLDTLWHCPIGRAAPAGSNPMLQLM